MFPSDSQSTLRLLDAAANRAREGLRVVEDFVRFVLDDVHLTRLLKECRHELAAALRMLDADRLLACRDTAGDVGTCITSEGESRRSSLVEVVSANFKRVQEALRTLEEFSKLRSQEPGVRGQASAGSSQEAVSSQRTTDNGQQSSIVNSESFSRSLEQLRYRFYTLEKAVLRTEANRRRLERRRLYLLLTCSQCRREVETVVRESLAGGVSVVQIREKGMSDRGLLEHARRVREWTRRAGALLIVNDRPDVALLCEADGVHVGRDELPLAECRRLVGPGLLIGASTHTIEQARQAVLDGADYLGVGPVFPSQTKRFDNLAGLDFVGEAAAEITLPWYAIGGITPENVNEVLAAGATRVAVSGAMCTADDPTTIAALLQNAISAFGSSVRT